MRRCAITPKPAWAPKYPNQSPVEAAKVIPNRQRSEPVAVPARGPWVVDWRNVTRDGQANDIVSARIDTALIGLYEGMTVSDLEEQIMDLELVAT